MTSRPAAASAAVSVLAAALAAAVVATLAGGCKRSSSGSGDGSGNAGPLAGDGDAGPVADGEPDEATVRAGKRTGLGAPDERPEVATEPLVRALVRGEVPWSKVVDPGRGVIELRSLPGSDDGPAVAEVGHRCGAALDRALAGFAAGVTAALDAPGLLQDVACDNVGLAVTIAGVASHAVCSVSSPAGDGVEHDLVLVPEPGRGLVLVGVSVADALTTAEELRDRFDEELGRYGRRCP
ncbi:MAG: hypothetical protein HS111_05515 [Kofleriaceae bacterium]|nr:hypothetical protein [Kofleriaceae bacterium]MCL4228964.1 hypothetical protein [Myxococcales bacterium]